MKKYLLPLFLIFSICEVYADAWDNLTEEQATEVIVYLYDNPFILDYCDCCNNSSVYLMKVLSSEIIPCSWDTEQKSVKVKAVRIAELERSGCYPTAYRAKAMSDTIDYTITMNYTFVYSDWGKWAVPFFKTVKYSDNHVCAGATRFPDPDENNDISDNDYKIWFAEKIKE